VLAGRLRGSPVMLAVCFAWCRCYQPKPVCGMASWRRLSSHAKELWIQPCKRSMERAFRSRLTRLNRSAARSQPLDRRQACPYRSPRSPPSARPGAHSRTCPIQPWRNGRDDLLHEGLMASGIGRHYRSKARRRWPCGTKHCDWQVRKSIPQENRQFRFRFFGCLLSPEDVEARTGCIEPTTQKHCNSHG
jgi:hypothetical protein